jgi:hypothetical protein
MKKLIFVTTLSAALLLVFSGCRHAGKGVQGSGVRKVEKRELGAFKSIETTGAFEILVACQQAPSFEIEGDDNLLPLVRTEVRGGVLHIFNQSNYRTAKGITVRIGVPDLEGILTTGAGDIRITNVKNDKLVVSSKGAARIEASGQTKFASITSTGAGQIDANKLHAESATVTVTGAGHVNVYATRRLDATVSGVGQITYDGDPAEVNRKVSGIGSINKKESGA